MKSKLLKQLIIFIATILIIIFLTGYTFKLLTNMTPDSYQIQLVINVLKFAIVFGVGSSILFSIKVFIKHSIENAKKIKESDEPQN